uniref:DUF1456 family protein n=1 Tax=Enterococcus faecium TaxID=1352 RepID=UPI00292E4E12
KEIKYINNVLLKKLKIALSMTTDDILDVFAEAEIYPSKGEIGDEDAQKVHHLRHWIKKSLDIGRKCIDQSNFYGRMQRIDPKQSQ